MGSSQTGLRCESLPGTGDSRMSTVDGERIADIVSSNEASVLANWIEQQLAGGRSKYDERELREQSRAFLSLFRAALQSGELENIDRPHWAEVRGMLGDLSRSRARQGFSPSETATFV